MSQIVLCKASSRHGSIGQSRNGSAVGRLLLRVPLLRANLGRQALVCAAAKTKSVKKSKAPQKRGKGFGPAKPSRGSGEAWEGELLQPAYRVYYKPGFKPSRYVGPINITRFDDGTLGVVAAQDLPAAQLLCCVPPLVFLKGGLGAPPAVEDLHVELLEAPLRPAEQQVLCLLPRKPLPPPPPPPATLSVVPDADGVEVAVTNGEAAGHEQHQQQEQPQPQPQQQPQQQQAGPDSLEQLAPAYWDVRGTGSPPLLPSRALMRLLQASCWSEEFQDPAASQVRHEPPAGFIGVWPEHSMLRHSCAPSASVVVVDRYMLLHASEDMPAGTEVTANKLGSNIVAPLAARQAAHLELFGRPCQCPRCALEGSLPADQRAAIESLHAAAEGEWPARLQAALQAAPQAGDEATADALAQLQADVADAIADVEEQLAVVLPERDERQLVLCAAYGAFDLAWQMEELLAEEPDLDLLMACVALQRLFARGSEGHVYSSLLLDQAYAARGEALQTDAAKRPRKTLARQRQLTRRIQMLLAGGEAAALAYFEAMTTRYGMIPQEGLMPQLEQALSVFYAGLTALSAGGEDGAAPEVSRSMTIDGIPVTVVDTVEGATGGGGGLHVDWLEDSDAADVDGALAAQP